MLCNWWQHKGAAIIYDVLNRVISTSITVSGIKETSTNTYDANTTNYTYDIHGRLLSKAIGQNAITHTYDNNGNKLTITDNTGVTTRTYDELNIAITKTVPVIGKSVYVYDITNNQVSGYTSETTIDPIQPTPLIELVTDLRRQVQLEVQ